MAASTVEQKLSTPPATLAQGLPQYDVNVATQTKLRLGFQFQESHSALHGVRNLILSAPCGSPDDPRSTENQFGCGEPRRLTPLCLDGSGLHYMTSSIALNVNDGKCAKGHACWFQKKFLRAARCSVNCPPPPADEEIGRGVSISLLRGRNQMRRCSEARARSVQAVLYIVECGGMGPGASEVSELTHWLFPRRVRRAGSARHGRTVINVIQWFAADVRDRRAKQGSGASVSRRNHAAGGGFSARRRYHRYEIVPEISKKDTALAKMSGVWD
ncbi:hypothetical protein C8J57DRAFT_1251917 [Mycena rebaudengoi]|nr:hypothetical protein C8J57DRAFT_1251917 [Mycena rebaudengoi]